MSNAALLIGVNNYVGGNNLLGCCNDVDNVYSLLIDDLKLFKSSEIVVLKDEQATRNNIIDYTREMILKLRTPPDHGFFGFSGHGSQTIDYDGDEVDGRDEILCPHDMNWKNKVYVTDDELGELFRGVPRGCWLEVVLDSCHSGTATRSCDKTFPSPYVKVNLPVRRMRRAVKGVRSHVLWSGCGDDQTSADAYLGGRFNGAFTYFWVKALREGKSRSREEILREVKNSLQLHNYSQVPRLTVPSLS